MATDTGSGYSESTRLTSEECRLIALGEFSASIAHEISNPLTIIVGQAEMMKLQLRKWPDTDVNLLYNYVHKIEFTTERISKIIKSLRSAASGDVSLESVLKVTTEKVYVKKIITDVYEAHSSSIKKNGITFKVNVQPQDLRVGMNEHEFGQICTNLITNAIEAVEGCVDKWISVDVVCFSGENGVRFIVTDSGPGISPEVRPKLFTALATTKNSEGAVDDGKIHGLGLNIVKRLAERAGGRVYVAANTPHTCFIVEIP